MASYYYLISSLPMLKSDGELPFSYRSFLEQCASSVSPSVLQSLKELDVISGQGPLLSDWSRYYGSLMRELNYQRNLRLGKQARQPEDRNPAAISSAAAAMSAKNPLEAELLLLTAEFKQLDELVSMHYFDEWVLFGYAVKLKLLERLQSFRHDEGKEEFHKLFDEIQQKILSI